MSSHVLPPPVPDLEEGQSRPKLWVIEEEQELELDISDVSEVGSSLTSDEIRTRYVDPTALDAAAALCGVPTGASISRGSFSDGAAEHVDTWRVCRGAHDRDVPAHLYARLCLLTMSRDPMCLP